MILKGIKITLFLQKTLLLVKNRVEYIYSKKGNEMTVTIGTEITLKDRSTPLRGKRGKVLNIFTDSMGDTVAEIKIYKPITGDDYIIIRPLKLACGMDLSFTIKEFTGELA